MVLQELVHGLAAVDSTLHISVLGHYKAFPLYGSEVDRCFQCCCFQLAWLSCVLFALIAALLITGISLALVQGLRGQILSYKFSRAIDPPET